MVCLDGRLLSEISDKSKGSEILPYDDAGRGSEMFQAKPEVPGMVLLPWLRSQWGHDASRARTTRFLAPYHYPGCFQIRGASKQNRAGSFGGPRLDVCAIRGGWLLVKSSQCV